MNALNLKVAVSLVNAALAAGTVLVMLGIFVFTRAARRANA